ncbi:hypothetical protein C0993_008131 [Termitomyces sp. T159_Od127]|nr:hypothetical protein C0993_008131 [Termitomyces sp. T159_Od127]
MSSNEEEFNDNDSTQTVKKRKVQRACDVCRRKKKTRTPQRVRQLTDRNDWMLNYSRYVERLEGRVEKLEKVLTKVSHELVSEIRPRTPDVYLKLCPGSNILKDIESVADTDAWLVECLPQPAQKSHPAPLIVPPRHPCEIATSVIRKVAQPVDFQVDDDFTHVILSDELKRLQISETEKNRFFGKSSGAMLVHAAMELKNEATGGQDDIRRPILGSKRDRFWMLAPVSCPSLERILV